MVACSDEPIGIFFDFGCSSFATCTSSTAGTQLWRVFPLPALPSCRSPFMSRLSSLWRAVISRK